MQSESELLAGLKDLAADVGADGVAEIVELFLDDSVELLRALRGASERSDAGGIMRAAHALKSTAATLGAADLSGLCLEMERLSREGMVREAIPHLPRVEAEYRHVRMLLEGLRGQVETADL